uniref:Putative secreted protein n=1 Tax=Ixodes ricinus TaxID=34613 RepID=A0A6B0UQS8_IXORI
MAAVCPLGSVCTMICCPPACSSCVCPLAWGIWSTCGCVVTWVMGVPESDCITATCCWWSAVATARDWPWDELAPTELTTWYCSICIPPRTRLGPGPVAARALRLSATSFKLVPNLPEAEWSHRRFC